MLIKNLEVKVITFSRYFPKSHSRSGEPTFFVEQILNSVMPKQKNGIIDRNKLGRKVLDIVNDFILLEGNLKKGHTIRAGNRWKVGDEFSPRVWSGKPYRSKQIEFALPIKIEKIWEFKIIFEPYHKATFFIDGQEIGDADLIDVIAKNDGLTTGDFYNWFNIHPSKPASRFVGQILCWDENIEY